VVSAIAAVAMKRNRSATMPLGALLSRR